MTHRTRPFLALILLVAALLGLAILLGCESAPTKFERGKQAYAKQDYVDAVKWYRQAAEQGYAEAQNSLGVSYANGQGVPQDYAEAVKWYRKAAEQGYAPAQNSLGISFGKGQGAPQDYAEAVKWLQKAAEQGYAEGQYGLGFCYDNGRGVSQDYTEAVKWYGKAAVQGYAEAQNSLGVSYANGQGVPQNYAEAVKWLRKAAEQGYAVAKNNLDILASEQPALEDSPASAAVFFQSCKKMDSLMNIKGVERLARFRISEVPKGCIAYGVLGFALEWQGQQEEAKAAYVKAGELLDSDKQYRSMIQQSLSPQGSGWALECAVFKKRVTGELGEYFFAGSDAEARMIAARVRARNNPNDPQAWFMLGILAATYEDMAIMAVCADHLEKLDPERYKQFKQNIMDPTAERLMSRLRQAGLKVSN